MTTCRIHTIHRPPNHPSKKPPLLFIHGGYVNAGCWDIHFLPWFAAQGYDCHAIDLSGHGLSEGRECIDSFCLKDYVKDVAQKIASFDRAPIVIGHSMGAAIVEQLMLDTPIEAAILLSPVPTIGTLGSVMRIACRYPQFFLEIARVSQLKITDENLSLMRDVYFSHKIQTKDLLSFAHLIQEESQRVVNELMMLAWKLQASRPKRPVLVMSGKEDMLFPPSLMPFVARRWQADLHIIPETGHVMMLDLTWEETAQQMLAWLQKKDY